MLCKYHQVFLCYFAPRNHQIHIILEVFAMDSTEPAYRQNGRLLEMNSIHLLILVIVGDYPINYCSIVRNLFLVFLLKVLQVKQHVCAYLLYRIVRISYIDFYCFLTILYIQNITIFQFDVFIFMKLYQELCSQHTLIQQQSQVFGPAFALQVFAVQWQDLEYRSDRVHIMEVTTGDYRTDIITDIFLIKSNEFAQIRQAIGGRHLWVGHNLIENLPDGLQVDIIILNPIFDMGFELLEDRLGSNMRQAIIEHRANCVLLFIDAVSMVEKLFI